jgi:hypothetical protein
LQLYAYGRLIVVQRIEMDLDEMITDQTAGRFRESRNV